ncbi:Pol polyprotein [Elysia marginata]|uniref:Pol polyprotein n=1 Tax=Elysia marginata TaxID=1093978 RepID=A0AAV4EA86_9GAST|nr:Pol polyprotein [Elysia marginata]
MPQKLTTSVTNYVNGRLFYSEKVCQIVYAKWKVVRVKPNPLPFASQEFVKEEVQKLLDLGVIEHSSSPYCSPIVIVKKKDGTLRLCIDFRKLNALTIFDANNIPLPEDLFAQLSHASIFTSYDLAKAYWQIPLHPESKIYTAFQTPLGLMQWTRMPFGLITAPATFCRLMRVVLGQSSSMLSYFDDTLLHTRTWEEHVIGLRRLLGALRKHGLTVNPAKLVVAQTSIEFQGHTLSNGTLTPIRKQVELTRPSTKKQVRSLMGLFSYYRSFVPDFAALLCPLTDILRKGSPDKIVWSDECERFFSRIKMLIASDPILIIPDMHAEFILRTDASDYGLGAVLLQERHGTLMPCRYASRKLSPREVRYSAIERECLAIVFAVKHFYRFLAFKPFHLETDHKPLLFLSEELKTDALGSSIAGICIVNFSFTRGTECSCGCTFTPVLN